MLRAVYSALTVVLSLCLLTACGDDDSPITDADASADQIMESARPDTPVGLTLAVPEFDGRPTTFSLLDDAGGAFKIDATSGTVSLATAVDYEQARERTIVAEVVVVSAGHRLKYERRFRIAVLDSPAPTVDISFPFAHARYSDPAISVSGRVAHPQLENVTISARAGAAPVDGEIVDGRFSIRELSIAGAGQFALTVTATHPGGDTTVQTLTLSREPELTDVPKMILDPARQRILLADRYTAAIVATPLNGTARVIVSGKHVGAGPLLVEPVALAMDSDGDTLYVADEELNAVFRVDLATGDRTLLSDRLHGSGPALFTPTEMDFDPVRAGVIVSDESQGVFLVDRATGNRRLVSSNANSGPYIYAYRGLGFDPVGDRYLVTDSSSVFAINPVTGNRTMVSDWLTDPSYGRFFRGMSVAAESGVVFLGDEMSDGVLRVDLASGARQTMTSSGLPAPWNFPVVGEGPPLQYPSDVVFDSAHGRLYVIEGEYADPLMEIGANGNRTVVRNASLGTGVNFRGPSGIKYDANRRSLLAADYVADLAVEMNVSNGNRTLIRGPVDGRGTIYEDPMDVAFNPRTGLFYVVDFQTGTLYSIDPGTGARRVISNASTGSGPQMGRPEFVDIDAEHGVAYILDRYYGGIFAVDLASGARRIVAAALGAPTALALDAAQQRLFVANDYPNGIYSVDLATGASRLVSAGSNSSFNTLAGIAYDDQQNRVIAIDDYPVRLYAVDIETGVRTTISGQINVVASLGRGPDLVWPRGVAVDADRQVAFVTDDAFDAVIAVDLVSGDRQVIAK